MEIHIVESEELIVELYQLWLDEMGLDANLSHSKSAYEAEEKIKNGAHFDLIIIEPFLPGHTKNCPLKSLEEAKVTTPKIIITSGLEINVLQDSPDIGKDCTILTKPVSFKEFEREIIKLVKL